ncbi:ES1 protein like protein, mitochondrial [Saliniradius amylolyticus]|uniref:Glyoxalase n=1 Tax=Saliniradius amylolyticus TaxID=2183582 RepID=A0A2S2DYU7_9ALTE|nr:isoprenoid biosynthesis glyoxalase ElbB [Saliniradius amylolyticus]AWL10529.1 ES1 protein like protein, mitochondrial [Saliniradius amylolyticus]
MQKAAIILSGCGVFDGAEINESVLTLLALERKEVQYQCFAPDIEQHHVVNHLTGEEMPESRNVLVESARITRGEVKPLEQLDAEQFDFLLIPGGFGVAKNLCDFAVRGADCEVNAQVLGKCRDFAQAGKAAGYMCIAPALLAQVYGKGVKGTIGHDKDTAEGLTQMGVEHIECDVENIVVDEVNKVVTTPAYMLAERIIEAATGIDKLVDKVVDLARG